MLWNAIPQANALVIISTDIALAPKGPTNCAMGMMKKLPESPTAVASMSRSLGKADTAHQLVMVKKIPKPITE